MNSFNDFKVPQIHSAGIAHFFPSVPFKLKKKMLTGILTAINQDFLQRLL